MFDRQFQTSFHQPRRRLDLLTRPRLNRRLEQLLQYRLSLLIAPPGYGKTSLIIDFAQESEKLICWYIIDQSDKNLIQFLENVVAAIAQVYPGFGEVSIPIIHDVYLREVGWERVVTVFVNEIVNKVKGPLYLFLDDFYLVDEDKEIRNFLSRLVEKMGDNCHLLITSRRQLHLHNLDMLVAHSQVGYIEAKDLAFQPGEIQQLGLKNYGLPLSLDEAKEIARETEGWITGLILFSDFHTKRMVEQKSAAKIPGAGLNTYLMKQILDPLPLEQRRFLLRTSLFLYFDSLLCETVLGWTVYPEETDWDNLIEAIVQKNLFVLTFEDEEKRFRYTHFFKDFLQLRFEKELPGEKAVILNRLAEVNMERGQYEEAYRNLLQLGDHQALMRLIEKAGPHLLLEGQHHTLIGWMDRLPAASLESHPHLLSLKGAAKTLGKEGEQAIPLLTRAEKSFRSSADRIGLAQTLVRRCIAYQFMGNHPAALSDAVEALAILKDYPGDAFSRAEALGIKGVALYDLGNSDEALEDLSQAADIYRSLQDEDRLASTLLDIGMVYRGRGEIQSSEDMYLQALSYLQEPKDKTRLANVYNNLGRFLLMQGNFPEAAGRLSQAMECARQIDYSRMEAFVLCSFGELFMELDAFEASRQMFSQARDIARKLKHLPLIFSIDLAEAELAIRMKTPNRAIHLLQHAEQYIVDSVSPHEKSNYQFVFGVFSLAEGQFDAALESFDRALIGFQMAKRQMDVRRTLFYQAVTLYRLDLLDQSLDHLKRALCEAESEVGSRGLEVIGWEAVNFLEIAQNFQTIAQPVFLLLNQIREFRQALPINRRLVRERSRAIPVLEPQIHIWGFGEPAVKIRDHLIQITDWQSPHQVEMLLYIILHPDGVTRSMLEDGFWIGEKRSDHSFKNAIYRLRLIVGEKTIIYQGNRYYFDRNLDYVCDFEEFESRYEQAEKASSEEERLEEYRHMAGLYHRGSLFQVPAGTWLNPIRESLRHKYLTAAYSLIHDQLRLQEYHEAEDYCKRILEEDEFQEEAHQLAMIAYAGQGNRKGIEEQYRWYVRVFQDQYQLGPSNKTRLLYESLIR